MSKRTGWAELSGLCWFYCSSRHKLTSQSSGIFQLLPDPSSSWHIWVWRTQSQRRLSLGEVSNVNLHFKAVFTCFRKTDHLLIKHPSTISSDTAWTLIHLPQIGLRALNPPNLRLAHIWLVEFLAECSAAITTSFDHLKRGMIFFSLDSFNLLLINKNGLRSGGWQGYEVNYWSLWRKALYKHKVLLHLTILKPSFLPFTKLSPPLGLYE